nr:DNA/RNA non-specific endonuclease [Bacteroidales bacterium]
KTLPLPNYYWKALLKVSRTGNNEINGACAIGFWLPHDDSIRVTTSAYQNYVVSVDQIEAWTGFDLFKNLPTALQDACEDDVNWTTFKNY